LRIIEKFKVSTMGRAFGVAEVHFNPVRGYSVMTEKRSIEVLLGMREVFDRIGRLNRFAQAIDSKGRRIQYIMADEPGRVIVKYRTFTTARGAGV